MIKEKCLRAGKTKKKELLCTSYLLDVITNNCNVGNTFINFS